MRSALPLLLAAASLLPMNLPAHETPTVVIAHRGASGYLPEHTLAGAAMAHAFGADFIEPDVVLTRDDVPIVLHDLTLDATTDVAARFPGRARPDGRHYAIDFAWEEIRTLRAQARINPATGRPQWPGRFRPGASDFGVPRLADFLALVQELNRTTGRTAGVYPEIKRPAWHAAEGKDAARLILAVLADAGYRERTDPVIVQCFDARTLRRLRTELGARLRLVQLIGDNSWEDAAGQDYDAMRTPEGLRAIAAYADGIGPWVPHVLAAGADGRLAPTSLVPDAHAAGLVVHAFTLRADALPAGVADFGELVELVARRAGADGFFTDFPDRALRHLGR